MWTKAAVPLPAEGEAGLEADAAGVRAATLSCLAALLRAQEVPARPQRPSSPQQTSKLPWSPGQLADLLLTSAGNGTANHHGDAARLWQ